MREFDRDAIEKLIKDGLCKEEIIKKLSIPSTSFYRWIKKNNITIPRSTTKFGSKLEFDAIIKLYKSGKTIAEIRKATGRSLRKLNAILSGLRHKRSRKVNIGVAILMHKSGKHPKEIADYFGVDVSSIRHSLKRRELVPIREKDPCEDRISEITSLLLQGKTQAEICNGLSLKSNTLNHFIKRHKLDSITKKDLTYSSSAAEREIVDFLSPYSPIHKYKYRGLKEIDIYVPDYKFGIEFCGLYWHTADKRGKRSHVDKFNECSAMGIQLFTIFDDEWENKKEIIKSMILAKMGKSKEIIYGRQCSAVQLNKFQAYAFLNENHLQGAPRNCILAIGLLLNNELIGCMTFGVHHRNSKVKLLNRLAFKTGLSIVGGASKMLKTSIPFLKNMGVDSITTYSDNRFSLGNVYEKMGFTMIKSLPIDYFYTKGKRKYSKQSMKKTLDERSGEATEEQLRANQGFYKVWDCGKKMWTLSLGNNN